LCRGGFYPMQRRGRKAAPGFLMVLYCHASFGAKAGANGLCGFFAIIDMPSKIRFRH